MFDLTVVTAALADLIDDAVDALSAVLPVAIGVIAAFIVFGIILRAVKRARG